MGEEYLRIQRDVSKRSEVSSRSCSEARAFISYFTEIALPEPLEVQKL